MRNRFVLICFVYLPVAILIISCAPLRDSEEARHVNEADPTLTDALARGPVWGEVVVVGGPRQVCSDQITITGFSVLVSFCPADSIGYDCTYQDILVAPGTRAGDKALFVPFGSSKPKGMYLIQQELVLPSGDIIRQGP